MQLMIERLHEFFFLIDQQKECIFFNSSDVPEASKLLKSDRQNLGKDLEKAAKVAGGKKIKISEILNKLLNNIGQKKSH